MAAMAQTEAVGVDQLRLKFPGEQSFVFRDLSLTVPAGQKVLLLGPSGCGKSTLLQVLGGLIPDSIEVPLVYDSIRIPESCGFVFQDPDTQFCMPYVDEELAFVLENLSVPREQMRARMTEALGQVGLALDDLHTPVQRLSQGMKQRLALASALLLDPDVLFLDEPTALLDPEGTRQVWESVSKIADGKTILIVEHKIDRIAEWADRVVLLNDKGAIIADGEPDVVFRTCRGQLQEYGIWHPGVWESYSASPSYRRLADQSPAPDDERRPVIVLRDWKGFRGTEERIAVEEAEIYPGDWIAVVGDNGAGKSTLLLSLMQLLRTEGTYELNGRSLSADGRQRSRNRQRMMTDDVGFVFQNPEFQFVTNTVHDEIAYSLRRDGAKSAARIEAAVAQMLDLFDLDVSTGRHPYQLSTGQKRRLSVATAVVCGQRVLLLDEPTFGQDARNTFAILETLERLRQQGTAIVTVTHDPQAVRHFATHVWQIEDGKLVRRDPAERDAFIPSRRAEREEEKRYELARTR